MADPLGLRGREAKNTWIAIGAAGERRVNFLGLMKECARMHAVLRVSNLKCEY